MEHIGKIIRQKRQEKDLSAEYVARHLKNPISKQAFARKERNGHFSYDLVLEVAQILNCDIKDFNENLTAYQQKKTTLT